ncbi:MAG: hypothetical protein A3H98_13670 [Bacteroidetes bacterium RIFCSPLOWO2_02_FULL_36_8]|nr:MAG: hypothetical protein A3H98_13670 [Bacteroidetes bacterium RIFCSPLOWO2_02_FULL_36_8]OFY70868.1 MAG: hypothetical protein A3G23_12165 [Bacteroidetes bacterium RIFCSPLOWO2_12_FULL_37_12]
MLFQIYCKTKKHEQALAHYEQYIVYRDSIKNKENEKAAIRQQTKYEFEKQLIVKEQEEKEKQRQEAVAVERRNNLQYSLLAVGIFIIFALLFFAFRFNLPVWLVNLLVFIPFLFLFEFLLIWLDPHTDQLITALTGQKGGEPAIKLLINAIMAGVIFPVHKFFERVLKGRMIGKGRGEK